jgi:hypothetical protein
MILRMEAGRSLLLRAACVLAAIAALILAAVVDEPILAVAGVGFLALAAAGRFLSLGDPIMAALVVLWLAVSIVLGVINAGKADKTPEDLARAFVREHYLGNPDDVHCDEDDICSLAGNGVFAAYRDGDRWSIEGAYFSRSQLKVP